MDFVAVLAQAPMFGALDPSELHDLAALAERIYLNFGQCLYREDDASDYLYFVVSGRLRVTAKGQLLGYVNRLETVGEVGVLTGESRSVSIHALRDSVLLRLPCAPLLDLLKHQSPVLMAITRMSLARARSNQVGQAQATIGRRGTLALIPATPSMPVMVLAEKLARHLSGWPQLRLITAAHVDAALGAGAAQTPFDDERGNMRLIDWLNDLENRHRYVIYAANSGADTWALRCLHQADRALVLAEANMPPQPLPVLNELPPGGLLAPIELVLLRPEGDPSPHTEAWRKEVKARAHFYVHPWEDADVSALTRQVTGCGVGLVLGGGGARGFAHIGLIRALRELRIPVDITGGTSMGAFISALMASGYDPVEMTQIARETFVNNNYLNDYTFPRVSLIRGRKFLSRLRQIFGERQIEELRRTYFCISSNLTTGETVVHDRGSLASWVGTSMAVPGVAPPVAYNGDLLCDGGVVNNLPTDIMQGLERGTTLACSVSAKGDVRAPGSNFSFGLPDPEALLRKLGKALRRPSLGEILVRSATLTSDTLIQRSAIERADIFIQMPVEDIGMFAWNRLDELIERGYEHALRKLTPLRARLTGVE